MPMKITTRANGRKYAEVSAPGVGRKRISLRTKSAKEAKQRAKEADLPRLERALQAGALAADAVGRLAHGRRVTLAQFLDRWVEAAPYRNESPSTTHSNRKIVSAWLEDAGAAKLPPSALTAAHLYEYLNRPDKRSRGTRERQRGAIASYLAFVNTATHALQPEILQVRVNLRAMPHVQREKKARRAFTPLEQDALLRHLDQAYEEARQEAASVDPKSRARAALDARHAAQVAAFWFFGTHLARAAGLRLGDIAQLEWASLGQPGHLVVWTDKRDRRVCLPINEELTPGLARALQRLPDSGDERFVFPALAARYEDLDKGRPWFSVTYSRIVKSLGFEGVTFHSWRHTALTRWQAQGFSLEQCADYAGHADTKTTKGYIHP